MSCILPPSIQSRLKAHILRSPQRRLSPVPPPAPPRSLVAPAASRGCLEQIWYGSTETVPTYYKQKAADLGCPGGSLWFYFLVGSRASQLPVRLLMTWQMSPSVPSCPLFPVPYPYPSPQPRGPLGEKGETCMHNRQPPPPQPPATCTVPSKFFDGSTRLGPLRHAEATGCPGLKQQKNLGS